MPTNSPWWTLVAVVIGGAISTTTALLVELRQSRRAYAANMRDARREFYLEIVQTMLRACDRAHAFGLLQDDASFARLREATTGVDAMLVKSSLIAPLHVRNQLADTIGKLGAVRWTDSPTSEEMATVDWSGFLHSVRDLRVVLSADLGADRPTQGWLQRQRTRWQSFRFWRRYYRQGTDAL